MAENDVFYEKHHNNCSLILHTNLAYNCIFWHFYIVVTTIILIVILVKSL